MIVSEAASLARGLGRLQGSPPSTSFGRPEVGGAADNRKEWSQCATAQEGAAQWYEELGFLQGK